MRVISGEAKGRPLLGPAGTFTRPMQDKIKEALFSMLWSLGVEPDRIADLYAGTGAIGIEAISRGARYALFVEEDATARGLIRSNVEAMGLTGKTRIFRRDATRLGEAGTVGSFSLVFADPPYGGGLGERALAAALSGGWMGEGALAVLEERRSAEVAPVPGLDVVDRRDVGDSQLVFLKRM